MLFRQLVKTPEHQSARSFDAVGQHSLSTESCRQDRVSMVMEARSFLEKSFFLEMLRNIEQHHLGSGNDTSSI
jgi:hypothetical protein